MATFIWTITHSYGLSVYSLGALGGGSNDYFANRHPEKSYDAVGTQFRGASTTSTSSAVPNSVYKEQDTYGNLYAVAYVYDASAGGYHVWRSRPLSDPDEDLSNWTDVNYNEYLSYQVVESDASVPIENPGTTTVINNSQITATDVALDYIDENTEDLTVADITNFESTWEEETDGSEFFNSRAILGIFGIPYQFMPHVDPRINLNTLGRGEYLTDYSSLGREYGHHIAQDMPILFISPGLPAFATNFSNEDKSLLGNVMTNVASGLGGGEATTDDLLTKQGKYYSFQYEVAQYYQYCNPACRIASAYMNVSDKYIDDTRIESLNWMNYTTTTLSGMFKDLGDITSYTSIPFYIESDTQISESFSNDVTDSSLTGIVDSVSDLGREAMFVLGYGNSALNAGIDWLSKTDNPDAVRQDIVDKFGNMANGNGFISNVISNLTSVATGGRLIFPKIWSDSGFGRSYDVTIKLRSPDMDNFSIYCNIIAPFLHLLGLVLPRQIQDNPNGFYSPFIVRAIYKGFFNVDMGIISSMSVSKGDTGLWNAAGIPCSIDVNLTITDLYENISMTGTTATNWAYDTLDNTCFMDYIANLCGINIYLPEVARTLRMWLVNNVTNRAADMINVGLWGNIQNSIANAITNVWRHS